ncbi:hypothetical protein K438DRAFT_1980029 [Mycena galopus ATCC 62051]|nr:hypothetical protein K438DRAFT_1980029 [Mycena galopus ATCC 62051]
MSKEGKPVHDKLEPAPAVQSESIGYFPQAPVYMLNSARDPSYRRGWRYAAPFHTSEREQQKQNMLNIRMPPNITPIHFDQSTRSFVAQPIPGMVRAPLGIPLVHHVDGDAKRAVTVVCVHTLETVQQYAQGPEIHDLAHQLLDLTWGHDAAGERPFQYGIFEILGMKTNLRSKHVDPNAPAGDGSFNIASTHGEGEGFGHFGPAIQTDAKEAAPIKSILQILHRLYRLVMPLCISRFEWEFMELNGYENNVLAFGGLEPGPPGCQVNSSSAANVIDLDVQSVGENTGPVLTNTSPLRRAHVEEVDDEDDHPASHLHPTSPFVILEPIEPETPATQDSFTLVDLTDLIYAELKKAGALDASIGTQGKPHGDFKDDPGWFTLFVLQFRLPAGSDMGPFLWMRSAIYVRETDQYILFLAFKGQDIHTGSAPTYIKTFMDDFPSSELAQKLFKRFGTQVRVGYVMYPSAGATSHSVQQLYTPSLNLLYSPGDPRAAKRRYYIPHGHTVMGDSHARANRLVREGVYALKNYLMQSNISLSFDVNALLGNSTFTDESGAVQRLKLAPIDIEDEEIYQILCLYRRFHFWWKGVMSEYALGVTKPLFKERQAQIKNILGGYVQPRQGIPTERNMIRAPQRSANSSNPVPRIERIISRRQNAGQGVWTIVLEGISDEVEYTQEAAKKLRSPDNDPKFAAYISKFGTGPPPPSFTGFNPSTNGDVSVALTTSTATATLAIAVNSNTGPPIPAVNPIAVAPTTPAVNDVAAAPAQSPKAARRGTKRKHMVILEDSDQDENANNELVADSDPEPQNAENDELPGDGPEFEVDSIIDWRDNDGVREWLKDYDESKNEWLNAEQLSGSQELLDEFNDQLDVSGHSAYKPELTPPSSDDEFQLPGQNRDKHGKRRARQVKLAPESLNSWKPQAKWVDDKQLRKLLDSVALQNECDAIKATSNILERPSDHKRVTDSPENIANRIIHQIEQQSNLSTRMYFELPSTGMGSEAWSSSLASLTLRCITDLSSTLPEMVALNHVHDLVSRGTAGQICRTLVAIYQWLVYLGPSLAAQLSSVHRNEGAEILGHKFPELAAAVEHILTFVRAHQDWQQQRDAARKTKTAMAARRQRKKRKVGEHSDSTVTNVVPESSHTVKAPSTEVPGDLWGLLPTSRAITIKLRPLPASTRLKTDDDVYSVASKILCAMWDENLILRPARDIKWWLNHRKASSQEDISHIRDWCIVRSAILQCLSDSFGDGLFVTTGIYDLLRHPCKIFAGANERTSHIARAIHESEGVTLSALDSYLIAAAIEDPILTEASTNLAELVHRGLLSLTLRRAVSDEEYTDPDTFENVLAKVAVRAGRGKKKLTALVPSVPTLAHLLPKKPALGIVAIIIREALADARKNLATPETSLFRRLLTGCHPTTGQQTALEPDQMQPIRWKLRGFTLLEEVLPFHLWTTATGLASLLVFMSTGQGSLTSEFILRMSTRPGKFHFTSLDRAIAEFEAVENDTATFGDAQQIKFCNPAIYGTANACSTGQSFENLIGPLKQQDPSTSNAPKIAWADALRWIVDTNLSGFGTGLATLQFANNLTLAGIATPPSPAQMAQWIYLNKDLGAFAGLQTCGFELAPDASPAAVRAAFFCFYAWLDYFLTKADKEVLGFGPIFAEHLLCKVGRWKKRLYKMSGRKMDLTTIAQELFEGKPWVSAENLADYTKWPIPSCADFDISVFKSIVEDSGISLDILEPMHVDV